MAELIGETVLEEMLLNYIDSNPQAADTAENIARWWLKMPLRTVLPALNRLVDEGVVERLSMQDQVVYRVKKECGAPSREL